MEYTEFSGKSLESVLEDACRQFSVEASALDYEIVDMGKSGILGFNAKPTVIKARVKEGYVPEKKEEKPAAPEKKEESVKETAVSETKTAEAETVSVKEAALDVNEEEIKTRIEKFLADLFKAMELDVSSSISFNAAEKTVNIDLSGPEMGILIGKRGQTLDSVQYLASLIVNKGTGEYIRVKVDTEDYRERRRKTLENLAKNLAFKVKRTKRPVSLEPMNPYERRIIHSALQGDRYVVTHSEGDEPFRRVVITLKK
ncbi:MAG: protein jag [Lachnospiraceae bacterium]|nr:protein jag [Lachnospiraceae bacterium]